MYRYGKSAFRTIEEGSEKEWSLVNGLGGFANGTILGNTSRMQAGYLIASFTPPVDRYLILSKIQERLTLNDKTIDFACQLYLREPKEGHKYLQSFTYDVIPEFHYQYGGFHMKKWIAMEYGHNTTAICYEVENGNTESLLSLTPLFSCRYMGKVCTSDEQHPTTNLSNRLLTLSYDRLPDHPIYFYTSEGTFYDRSLIPTSMATPNYLVEENQYYLIDNRTGFGGLDNHATPYDIQITLKPYEKKRFFCICSTEPIEPDTCDGFSIVSQYRKRIYQLMDMPVSQDSLSRKFAWSSDQFITRRESTGLKTILAGLPWFTDWGRDTMIAMTGLTLCTGRFNDCREILASFARYEKNGLLPNVFPNSAKEEPMYNTIDASLWYFYAVERFLHYAGTKDNYRFIENDIYPVLEKIIHAYQNGTDFSIGMDEDGLIHGGSDKDQITWMDVRVGDWVVTPRHGKPVEISALWYNALCVMADLAGHFEKDNSHYLTLAKKVKESFLNRYWNEEKHCLYDVIDPCENAIRPNQIWAVSLPYTMLSPEQEKEVVQTVTEKLYTAYGLRSLAPDEPGFQKEYIGALIKRDGAYHMGTVWAFPLGGYISAYCKVHNHSPEAIQHALDMIHLIEDHMHDGCINGIAEIFDGESPCTSRGCYNQAWSIGEIFRAYTEEIVPYM